MRAIVFESPRNAFTTFMILLLIWCIAKIVVFAKVIGYLGGIRRAPEAANPLAGGSSFRSVYAEAKVITNTICRFVFLIEIIFFILLLIYG